MLLYANAIPSAYLSPGISIVIYVAVMAEAQQCLAELGSEGPQWWIVSCHPKELAAEKKSARRNSPRSSRRALFSRLTGLALFG